MDITTWLSLVAICMLGAMSPGPSIAIIIQITSTRGRTQGILGGIGHGVGIGCYAVLAVAGLAAAIEQSPLIFNILQYVGAGFLAYIGLQALGVSWPDRSKNIEPSSEVAGATSSNSFIIGFLTAFLNPKVALFFLALFSQFIHSDADMTEKTILASTVAITDTIWYCLVAIVSSQDRVTRKFAPYGKLLQKAFGLLLVILALRLALG